MKKFFEKIIGPAKPKHAEAAFCCMRIGIGLIMFGHGVPKLLMGVPIWEQLGTFVNPLGIYFLPIMWGFLGACTEFFGGLMLASGFLTRIASLALSIMMFVAFIWHLDRGDSFAQSGHPLALLFVFIAFFVIGAGKYSLDAYLNKKIIS
jgi:putative oxidoreductase